ncbi:Aldo/keto reductase [Scheffersomyces xylosifermentans]|uniref:Aldo/keto reductase n=1 Tax=Scheffersomyces xylosifermentans TaxID=1304137 RepID=UPI00315D7D5B
MTKAVTKPVKLTQNFTTKSGIPITIGTGTGTKWQWLKKGRPEDQKDTLVTELVDQLLLALQNGYNHIDTAEVYTTHPEVAEAVKKSGIPREDLFITTKYSPGFRTFQALSKGPTDFIDTALKELQTDYVDLFLIHSPFFDEAVSRGQTLESSWAEVIEAKKAGKVREIGVSNYAKPHLEKIFKVAGSTEFYPKVNQIEFHPYLQNQSKDIVKFAQENDILIEAYGPLTPLFRIKKDGKDVEDHPLKPLLQELSEKYGKTDAQILLRYTLQKGILPITTSTKVERIKQSLEVYEFEITAEDVAKIDEVGASYPFRQFFDQEYKNL